MCGLRIGVLTESVGFIRFKKPSELARTALSILILRTWASVEGSLWQVVGGVLAYIAYAWYFVFDLLWFQTFFWVSSGFQSLVCDASFLASIYGALRLCFLIVLMPFSLWLPASWRSHVCDFFLFRTRCPLLFSCFFSIFSAAFSQFWDADQHKYCDRSLLLAIDGWCALAPWNLIAESLAKFAYSFELLITTEEASNGRNPENTFESKGPHYIEEAPLHNNNPDVMNNK